VPVADEAVREEEASALFSGLEGARGLVLAVSGGPDSTALLLLVARWAEKLRDQQSRAPKLLAVTVDHGLRPEAAREAAAVRRLARRFGISHRTVRWRGKKPVTGLQEVARGARYRLLAEAAMRARYEHILVAHTLDDQAETVLFRLTRGSGLTGLAGMPRIASAAHWGQPPGAPEASELDAELAHGNDASRPGGSARKAEPRQDAVTILRPFLHLPKRRLVATLEAAGIGYSEDPTNSDPRFARPRLRALLPQLAREGLDARSLARFAARMRRAEAAIELAVAAARAALAPGGWPTGGPVHFETLRFAGLPAEVALRLLGRAISHAGNEGPVELGKLETLYATLRTARSPLRRTLAGALVTLSPERLTIERAPARRGRP
jgi:tRNA(Ile)-lysidine synthase